MEKFYRATKDSFLWKKGAILWKDEDEGEEGGYYPLNKLDIWDATPVNEGEYISARVIEFATEWFERVYPADDSEDPEFLNAEEMTRKLEGKFTSSIPVYSAKLTGQQGITRTPPSPGAY